MRSNFRYTTFAALALGAVLSASLVQAQRKPGALDFSVKSIDGRSVKLSRYRGKVVMIVNVASRCGNTPQYAGLQAIYEKYRKQGFVVLGFPANEFGAQEPGTDSEIKQFCTANYKVTFPMFSKVVVKGEGQAPLYRYLTSKDTNPEFAGEIEWNFAKFLIGRDGKPAARFSPRTQPNDPTVTEAIEKLLKAKREAR
ncbi:MAG: glutathione peroxidase [Armatimonadetes bacterium]|nr:glutathione peroxidase [Armatimonadota bacterium]